MLFHRFLWTVIWGDVNNSGSPFAPAYIAADSNNILTALTQCLELRIFSCITRQWLPTLSLKHQSIMKFISSAWTFTVISPGVRPTKSENRMIRIVWSSTHIWHISTSCNFLNLLQCSSSEELCMHKRLFFFSPEIKKKIFARNIVFFTHGMLTRDHSPNLSW